MVEKAKSYDDKYEGGLEVSTIFNTRLNDLKNEIKVQLPCRVYSVNYNTNQVNVQILDNDVDNNGNVIEYPIIPNVPIRQPIYSGSAYMILPVRIGDIGTIEFFDTSVKDLIVNDTYSYDYSEEWHSLNNGLFTNGFLPKNKVVPIDSTNKIIMATSNGEFTFKVNANNQLVVVAPSISITSNVNIEGNLTASGTITGNVDVVGGGKSLKSHKHQDSQGGNTSAPL